MSGLASAWYVFPGRTLSARDPHRQQSMPQRERNTQHGTASTGNCGHSRVRSDDYLRFVTTLPSLSTVQDETCARDSPPEPARYLA
jgi:hypothetical protein